MRSIADLLSEHRFFAGLDDATLELVAGCGENVHFDADHQISCEGDAADHFYVLRSGKVALEVETPRQGAQVIETIGPGALVGVSWLIPPHRWTFGARAVEPVRAVAIDAACLRGKCDADPALGYELLTRFATVVRTRLQATRLLLLDLYGSNAS